MEVYGHAIGRARAGDIESLRSLIASNPSVLWSTSVTARGRVVHGLIDDVSRLTTVGHPVLVFLVHEFVRHMKDSYSFCAPITPHIFAALCSDVHTWDSICMEAAAVFAKTCTERLTGATLDTFVDAAFLRWSKSTAAMISFDARSMYCHNAKLIIERADKTQRLQNTLQHASVIIVLASALKKPWPPQAIVSLALLSGVLMLWSSLKGMQNNLAGTLAKLSKIFCYATSRVADPTEKSKILMECTDAIICRFGPRAVPNFLRPFSVSRVLDCRRKSLIHHMSETYSVISDRRFRMNLSAMALLATSCSSSTMRMCTDQGINGYHLCASKYGNCRWTYENPILFGHYKSVMDSADPADLLYLNCRARCTLTTLAYSALRCSRATTCNKILLDSRIKEIIATQSVQKSLEQAPDHIIRAFVLILFVGCLYRSAHQASLVGLRRTPRPVWSHSIFNFSPKLKFGKEGKTVVQSMVLQGVLDPLRFTKLLGGIVWPFYSVRRHGRLVPSQKAVIRALFCCAARSSECLPFLPREIVAHIASFLRFVDIGSPSDDLTSAYELV